jgi:hypothetical protein
MSDRTVALEAVRAFVTDPSDKHADALRPYLADEVAVSVHTINETGSDAAITGFQESLFHNVVFGGAWDEPSTESNATTQVLSMPAKGIAAGCRFKFSFNDRDEFDKIEGGWILPPAILEPEPVVLTTAMRARINSAEDDLMPVLFAYMTPDGRPEHFYRSSTHTRADDQLAFWNPRQADSFLSAVAVNPLVSAIYRHTESHEMLEMSGRARLVDDDEEAKQIYEARLAAVQRVDPDMAGAAVIIDLDRVTGLIHAADTGAIERIQMARSETG